MSGQLIDKLLKKRWTDQDIGKMMGPYRSAYLTYARDEAIRSVAASGGTTSALLCEALCLGLIDGAIVCKTVIEDGKVRARFTVATTPDEILAARGSKYVETRFMKEALPLIRGFDGRLAVIGLPCDITNLTRRMEKEPNVEEKVALKIVLVCGHNSRTELIDHITGSLGKQAQSPLIDYRFRTGHWRGKLTATFANGEAIQKPFSYFSLYQNLYFFSEKKCLACHDHFGYDADITIGDVWSYRLKENPIKHTGVVIRTERGERLWDQSTAEGSIVTETMQITEILDGQARVAPFHYNVSARSRVAKYFGYKLPDKLGEKVSWHEWVAAYTALLNMRWSESPKWRSLIFRVPRPLLKTYLYFRKGLESLK